MMTQQSPDELCCATLEAVYPPPDGGGVVWFDTVTEILAVFVFPALSVAVAVMVCDAFE